MDAEKQFADAVMLLNTAIRHYNAGKPIGPALHLLRIVIENLEGIDARSGKGRAIHSTGIETIQTPIV